MAQLLEQSEIMYTPFEPKAQNRFIMAMNGIESFMVKKINRPILECGEVVVDHINVIRKLKGKCKWGDITMTLYDPIVPSAAQQVMTWIRTSHESVTGRDGYGDYYKKNFDIYVLGPVGDKIENWKIKGAWVKSFQGGDMDWSADGTPIELTLTCAIDYAVLEY